MTASDKRRKRLSANQLNVLRMACTHGDLTRGCRGMADHGGRGSTLKSLRRAGLIDAAGAPTDEGRAVFAAATKEPR